MPRKMIHKKRIPSEEQDLIVPLHAEEVAVEKERIVTGGARVSITTRHDEKRVEESLVRERVEIERRPIGKLLEQAPVIREEEDTIIIPVVEEEIVVERRLILKEEIRIRRVRESERYEERVQLRRQDGTITRYSVPAEAGTEPHPGKG
jgi:uncharacterized protein (TIGR02271 family)